MSDDPYASRSPSQDPDEERPAPFERFEETLRKVLAAPKAEIDKKRRPAR